MTTKYFFFRNDQENAFFEFNPCDPTCLDKVNYQYYGRVLHYLEPYLRDKNLIIYVTGWTVHELPTYGTNVISFILQDEWAREPKYRHKVPLIFKTCGLSPIVPQVFMKGSILEKGMNILAQSKAISSDGAGRITSQTRHLMHQKLSPIYQIPLGYFADEDIPFIPFSERENDIFFAGSVQHLTSQKIKIKKPKEMARDRMLEALELLSSKNDAIRINLKLTNSFKSSISSDNASYLQNMMNTKLCPIPRGTNLETYRFYEAIRFGCIPVGEVFPNAWFYKNAPIVKLSSWDQLEKKAKRILSNPELAETLHKQALNWWHKTCSEKATAQYIKETILSRI